MKFGYTIIYVPDVVVSVTFFEQAFGLKRRFIHESGYAELDTGETALAFASHELGRSNLPEGYVRADESEKPLGTEIALVTEQVADAYARAIATGAVSIKGPVEKPWGVVFPSLINQYHTRLDRIREHGAGSTKYEHIERYYKVLENLFHQEYQSKPQKVLSHAKDLEAAYLHFLREEYQNLYPKNENEE